MNIMRTYNSQVGKYGMHIMMQKADTDHSGSIDKEEWLKVLHTEEVHAQHPNISTHKLVLTPGATKPDLKHIAAPHIQFDKYKN